jgi:glycosyltransferase involved in cell wall biosynthesis
VVKWLARLAFHYLRIADFAAAQRVDRFVANSEYTKSRINSYYRRESEVIYPPIDIAFYTPSASENKYSLEKKDRYFLCVGRLTSTKYFDQAVRVMSKLGLSLVVVGRGRNRKILQKSASGKIRIIEREVTKKELRSYYRRARALLQTGVEDFGMASVESMACGTPVVALGRGGIKEIVEDGATGVLYEDPSDEALADAIRRFLVLEKRFERHLLQSSVLKFGRKGWQEKMINVVEKLAEEPRKDRKDIVV